eukprot:CAMPEP_0174922436 /NCGR_PEP_ID=MMETSP1355-20121228/5878_1 /TAXON_ID=464990 /ORGANISM="Hemiselmis tepida, Strain CCMP443" /LENGTH=227 /DNA_ID=CAMNT_0016168021 /DNA_START=22 /DNA_END=702 /DNA_ORIENTATION=-
MRYRDLLDRMELDLARERSKRADRDNILSSLVSEGIDVFGRAGLHWLAPWPRWLRVLSLPTFRDLLPQVSVQVGGVVNGVMLYSLEVSQGCDRRGSWVVIKRFSHVVALHAALCRELPRYGADPPLLARECVSERSRVWKGAAEECAGRRRGLVQSYVSFLARTVECLASRSLREFLDMRDDLLDYASLEGRGSAFLTSVQGGRLRGEEEEESPVKPLSVMAQRYGV